MEKFINNINEENRHPITSLVTRSLTPNLKQLFSTRRSSNEAIVNVGNANVDSNKNVENNL